MVKKYKARSGAKFSDKQAQVIGKALNSLRDKEGHISSEEIVKSASNKKSPLYEFFTWDNTKAAAEFRLHQARSLVNHIVEVVVVSGKEVTQRSFFSVTAEDKGKVYVTLKDAIETEDYRKQLLSNIITTLENLTITMKLFKEQDYSQ